jgi:hypothetical protein
MAGYGARGGEVRKREVCVGGGPSDMFHYRLLLFLRKSKFLVTSLHSTLSIYMSSFY